LLPCTPLLLLLHFLLFYPRWVSFLLLLLLRTTFDVFLYYLSPPPSLSLSLSDLSSIK